MLEHTEPVHYAVLSHSFWVLSAECKLPAPSPSVRLWTSLSCSEPTPRKFWQAARLPNDLPPQELHDPTTWDSFLSKLTAPPAQYATQLPAPHTPQPPAPAHSLNQPLTLAEVEVGCTMAGQEPCTATPRSCCVMPSLWPHQMTQRQLTYWHLAFWCYSMLPGRCPNPRRLP